MNDISVYLLIGLPGSGKSTWLSKIEDKHQFDDISQIPSGLESLKKVLESSDTQRVYISDVNFSDISVLQKAKGLLLKTNPHIEYHYVFFNCSSEQAIRNVKSRNDGRYVFPTIERFKDKIKEVEKYLLTEKNVTTISFPHYKIKP